MGTVAGIALYIAYIIYRVIVDCIAKREREAILKNQMRIDANLMNINRALSSTPFIKYTFTDEHDT